MHLIVKSPYLNCILKDSGGGGEINFISGIPYFRNNIFEKIKLIFITFSEVVLCFSQPESKKLEMKSIVLT